MIVLNDTLQFSLLHLWYIDCLNVPEVGDSMSPLSINRSCIFTFKISLKLPYLNPNSLRSSKDIRLRTSSKVRPSQAN